MSARESIIPVFVPHWGCPHTCVFCNQHRIAGTGEPVTAAAVTHAIETAAAFLPAGGKRQLAFYGGSFTAIEAEEQEALLAAAQACRARGLIDAVRLSTRPDAIDDAVLDRLERYGVETVELGAQSMDDEVLRLTERGHTAADVVRASRLIQARGFRLILQMMTGLPGSSRDKDVATAERLIALRPDGVRIYPTVIVRHTALYEQWCAGTYREHTVEDAVAVCAEILPRFEAAGIPVIRLGLNPTEELTQESAVGGAYHPALGELVRSRIYLNRARELLAGVEAGSRVTLTVGRGKRSQMTGQHRCNLTALREEFGLAEIQIAENEALTGEMLRVLVEKPAEMRYNKSVNSSS